MNSEEQKLKDLLYEHSTRRMLKSSAASQGSTIKWIRIATTLAASAVVIFAALQLWNRADSSNSRNEWITEVFEVPKVNKSRSAVANIIDEYIAEVNSGNYINALKSLENNAKTDKDRLYKAYLLFSENRLKECKDWIAQHNNPTSDYQDDYNWIHFLLSVKNGESKDMLIDEAKNLSDKYFSKAKDLLEKL